MCLIFFKSNINQRLFYRAMTIRDDIVTLLHDVTGLPLNDISLLLAVPPDAMLGDYAFGCFKLGGNAFENAQKLQQKLQEKIPKLLFLSRVEAAGPYVNFYMNKSFLAQQTIGKILKQKKKFGSQKSSQKREKKILVEYCGPNTNKPLHLGHMRNMSLGGATCNLLSFMGNEVHPVNIVNDRGVHICKSMLAYQKWGKDEDGKWKTPDKKSDHFVGDFYVLYAQKAKEDPKLEEEVQEMLQKWEQGDATVRALWKKMNRWVLTGFAQTYKRFGVWFEKEYFESRCYEKGKEMVMEGFARGVFEKDDTGAIVAPLENVSIEKISVEKIDTIFAGKKLPTLLHHKLPNKVVLRADGTSIYITQDMYLAKLRYEDYAFDKLIYVVASEQNLHFLQLFRILELLGYGFVQKLFHLSYGMVNLPTGKMKSREGTVVDADDLMDEVAEMAHGEVVKRFPALPEQEKKKRAEFIALGAIKFFLLRTDAIRDIVFNPEESLSFEGETGPYLQYTHARACAILRKSLIEGSAQMRRKIDARNASLLKEDSELKLVTLLSQFSERVDESAQHLRIHILCRYLLDLAQAFNEFYHACHVLSEDTKMQDVRLALVDATRQVLANGLGILGIYAPEEM